MNKPNQLGAIMLSGLLLGCASTDRAGHTPEDVAAVSRRLAGIR